MSKTNQMTKYLKTEVINKNALHPKDCGSAQVQVAILKMRLKMIQDHLNRHPKDVTVKRTIPMIKRDIRVFEAQIQKKPTITDASLKTANKTAVANKTEVKKKSK